MEAWLQPLFDAEGIRAVDRWAIEEQGVTSAQLMEAAATALAEAVAGLSPQGPVRVVCGKGNNGGDGEIAARHLTRMGFDVDVAQVAGEGSPADLDAWLAGSGAVVDAIFGTGFAGEPREPAAAAIDAINRCGAPVIACDIASGVDASSGEIAGIAVEADLTVSFHAAKLGHRIAPGKWHCGELLVVPIGIPTGAPAAPSAPRSWPWRRTGARARPSSAPAR
jgi:NAD(P)H-hydrate epimerase